MGELSLRQKQSLFTVLLAQLILHAHSKGWELTLGDGSIDPLRRVRFNKRILVGRDLNHMEDGLHYQRLAQDLNLFVNEKWMDRDCPEWQELGKTWEGFHPLARWGGRFAFVDLNHISIEHGGKK